MALGSHGELRGPFVDVDVVDVLDSFEVFGETAGSRHLVVDTRGLPLLVMVTPADVHDAVAAKEVFLRLRLLPPPRK